jgi:hypothetical protein
MKLPAEAPRSLAAVERRTRIACASENSVETVSKILDVSSRAYRNRLDSGRPPGDGSFRFAAVVFEDR